MLENIRAKAMWSGDRFSLETGSPVYVVKTFRANSSSAVTVRSERRLTGMTRGLFGMGKRWKTWSELKTPIEEQNLEQEVMKIIPD